MSVKVQALLSRQNRFMTAQFTLTKKSVPQPMSTCTFTLIVPPCHNILVRSLHHHTTLKPLNHYQECWKQK